MDLAKRVMTISFVSRIAAKAVDEVFIARPIA
jgi:hypothetical protein